MMLSQMPGVCQGGMLKFRIDPRIIFACIIEILVLVFGVGS